MQENRKNILISIGFVVILILVFIINILSKDKIISTSERRKLVQFPEITTKKVFDGTVSKDFEEYAMDQFVGRDLLRSIKSLFNFEIYRQKDNNKLFIENDSIYKIEYPLKEELIEKTAKRIEQIKEKYLKNMNVYYAIVPDKNYFLEEDAIGVVEIILILVILIALVLIFKTKITSVVTKAFTNFTRDTGKILA